MTDRLTLLAFSAVLLASAAALAQEPNPNEAAAARTRGDHPAVVVQRLRQSAGHDYAANFYPHPAWLYLRPASEGPLVDVAPAPALRADVARRDARPR